MAPRVHRQPAWVTVATRELASPWRLIPSASRAVGARTVDPPRNGLLLLGTALALAVLALASGSLFRLLRQGQGVRLR